jgi:ligand-binding sensor domain-containing protein
VIFTRKQLNLLINSTLGGILAISGLNISAIAQSSLDVDPGELTPSYPNSAPPPRDEKVPVNSDVDYRVSALQTDFTGNLWVGSWRGLSRIDPNTGNILARVNLPNLAIGALTQDKVGRLWVGTYEGLKRVDLRTNEITAQNLLLPSKRVLSLLLDKRGYLWTGTDNGLALVSPDQGLIMTTVKNLPGVSANAMTLDADGQLWVGTLDGLIYLVQVCKHWQLAPRD